MDPTTAHQRAADNAAAILDKTAEHMGRPELEERAVALAVAFEALDGWIAAGGFPPDRWAPHKDPQEVPRPVYDETAAILADAAAAATYYYDGMTDPLYALASTGAIVTSGPVTLAEALKDARDTANANAQSQYDTGPAEAAEDAQTADTFQELREVLHEALHLADVEGYADDNDPDDPRSPAAQHRAQRIAHIINAWTRGEITYSTTPYSSAAVGGMRVTILPQHINRYRYETADRMDRR